MTDNPNMNYYYERNNAMKTLKKRTSLLIALIIALSCLQICALADFPQTNNDVPSIVEENNAQERVIGGFTYVYGTPVTTTVSGYASGQPTNGYSTTTGMSVIYMETGGSGIGKSINFSDPIGIVTLSFDIGKVQTSGAQGIAYTIPADGRFYKIYVTKQFKVTPKMMYHYNEVTHEYDELVSTTYVKELISLSAYARAVG